MHDNSYCMGLFDAISSHVHSDHIILTIIMTIMHDIHIT